MSQTTYTYLLNTITQLGQTCIHPENMLQLERNQIHSYRIQSLNRETLVFVPGTCYMWNVMKYISIEYNHSIADTLVFVS